MRVEPPTPGWQTANIDRPARFSQVLTQNGEVERTAALRQARLDPLTTEAALLNEDGIKLLLVKALRGKADSTQSLYLTTASMFYKYLVADSQAVKNPGQN
jgi:hypothetical protein